MLQKRIYIILVILLVIIASVILAFALRNDTNEVYRGTLVKKSRVETEVNVLEKS